MKIIKYIIAVVLFLSLFFNYKYYNYKGVSIVRTDTVEVVKYLPSKANDFKDLKPKEVVVYKDNSKSFKILIKELKTKYNNKVDSIVILKELLSAKTQRKYVKTFKDSVLDAEVVSFTTGKLDSLYFTYKTKPQRIVTNEITHKIKPKYSVLAGLSLESSALQSSIGGNIGYQDASGNVYTLGYGTDKQIKFTFLYNLFEKY